MYWGMQTPVEDFEKPLHNPQCQSYSLVCAQQPRDNRAIFFEDENGDIITPATVSRGAPQILLLTATSPRHILSNAVVYARWGYTHTANQTLEMLHI